jgi:hypothetical protein
MVITWSYVDENDYFLGMVESDETISPGPEYVPYFPVGDFFIIKFNRLTNEFYEGSTPEEYAQYIRFRIASFKEAMLQQLAPTDMYVMSMLERGSVIPAEVKTQRDAVYNSLNAQIHTADPSYKLFISTGSRVALTHKMVAGAAAASFINTDIIGCSEVYTVMIGGISYQDPEFNNVTGEIMVGVSTGDKITTTFA